MASEPEEKKPNYSTRRTVKNEMLIGPPLVLISH